MACEIVINAKRRKQSWENKYAMLGMEGSARRSQGGWRRLGKGILSQGLQEAKEQAVGARAF